MKTVFAFYPRNNTSKSMQIKSFSYWLSLCSLLNTHKSKSKTLPKSIWEYIFKRFYYQYNLIYSLKDEIKERYSKIPKSTKLFGLIID